ncbi:hypothetical protein BG015_005289 [Linnemannia schmuckeri]|uniref:Uncharacterized protein n=1 Tax=Linnemannia schmuckeri TaxID=64567 RepID=A0A9P5R8H7_9FUNG|nr:hypothetical protein BG015_005289 [Linnemannia schmuckeri]
MSSSGSTKRQSGSVTSTATASSSKRRRPLIKALLPITLDLPEVEDLPEDVPVGYQNFRHPENRTGTWDDAEENVLLGWLNTPENYALFLNPANHRPPLTGEYILERLRYILQKNGYPRDPVSVKNKLKSLADWYKNAKLLLSMTGQGNTDKANLIQRVLKRCRYYYTVDPIWGSNMRTEPINILQSDDVEGENEAEGQEQEDEYQDEPDDNIPAEILGWDRTLMAEKRQSTSTVTRATTTNQRKDTGDSITNTLALPAKESMSRRDTNTKDNIMERQLLENTMKKQRFERPKVDVEAQLIKKEIKEETKQYRVQAATQRKELDLQQKEIARQQSCFNQEEATKRLEMRNAHKLKKLQLQLEMEKLKPQQTK